ncbi:uncharacterized protein LOC103179522 isoform X2 [Callorhinchus milii]|uniref:uncharacterized protein LOC103179522 isoform X2 n=1 Tax=Callorhinchus milii TaxID=7868 RepID=UPI001C3FC12F|nr:uncharacterized protein LOC103179522 isoform X2 [Callorhinchus milii]
MPLFIARWLCRLAVQLRRKQSCCGAFLLLTVLLQTQASASLGCLLTVRSAEQLLNVSVGDQLQLKCTVQFCGKKQLPETYWCKFSTNSCQPLNETTRLYPDTPLSVQISKAPLNPSVGESLSLNCTVRFYAKEGSLPEAFWCKRGGDGCPRLAGTIHYPTFSKNKEMFIFVIYTILSVELSDNGTFQCWARQGNAKAGRSITVNIQEAGQERGFWTVYSLCRWIMFGLLITVPVPFCHSSCSRGKRDGNGQH